MNQLASLAPLLLVLLASLIILLLEAFGRWTQRSWHATIAVAALIGSIFLALNWWEKSATYFSGAYMMDKVAIIFMVLFSLAGILVILLSFPYMVDHGFNRGEFFSLLLLAITGLMIMASSEDLVVIFLGLETLSVASYVLAGMKKQDEKSSEAAIKYFLLGSLASAFIILGLAFFSAQNQSLNLRQLTSLATDKIESPLFLAGLCLLLVGFGFKVSLVPFHMWTPDVYQGAPTPITAFFSVGPKAAGFLVLFRLFYSIMKMEADVSSIQTIIWILSVLTMVVGNLIALRQRNVKRLLAYSSIAHAGYLTIALLSRDGQGLTFYLLAYLFMNVGAFAVLVALSAKGQEFHELEDFNGLGERRPWLAAAMSVFLLSLAGFPPTAGFLAKFYVFSTAVKQGFTSLIIIAVLASLVSVYYYLRVIVHMYMIKEAPALPAIKAEPPLLLIVIFFCLYGVFQLGLFPARLISLIRQALTTSLP